MKRIGKRAFTLVEIMIAVSVIAVLAAIAIPNFLSYRQVSHDNTCVGNKNLICAACEACLLQLGTVVTDIDTLKSVGSDKVQFLRESPNCPVAGKYEISNDAQTGFSVKCTKDGSVHKASE